MRGTPTDYDSWGSELWTYDAVLPCFRRSETDLDFNDEYHGDSGPIPVRRYAPQEWLPLHEAFYSACLSAGFRDKPDLNNPNGQGIGPTPVNSVGGIRHSTAITYLANSRRHSNLTVLANHHASRVLFDHARAIGIEAITAGITGNYYGGEIVLAAGGEASAHLLMLSGIGPVDELEPSGIKIRVPLASVGRNLSDHANLAFRLRPRSKAHYRPYMGLRQMVLTYTSKIPECENDMQIGSALDTTPDELTLRCSLGKPVATGNLRLISADPATRMWLDYRYLQEEADRLRMREAARICLALIRSADLKQVAAEMIEPRNPMKNDAEVDAWMLENVGTSMHASSACRMGIDAESSVVDDHLRVHGIQHLRVADISISPQVVSTPTNATAMMIGERAADILRHDLRSTPLSM
jgi:choline dehydrogenase